MRGVAAARGEVDEERLVRVLAPHAVQPFDGLVGHRVRQVVRARLVVVLRGGSDDLLVLGQTRVPLPGVAPQEAVEVVEAPPGRPPVQRAGGSLLPVRGHVPLPEGSRAVAVVAQDPRKRGTVLGQHGGVAGEPAGELPDRTEADGVVVPSCQQRGPGGGTQGGDVEAVVAQAALGRPRVVRGVDGSPEGARVPEPGVVDQHQQHVRSPLRRLRMADQVPVRLRAPKGAVGGSPELRCGQRQGPAVEAGHVWSPRPSSAPTRSCAGRAG